MKKTYLLLFFLSASWVTGAQNLQSFYEGRKYGFKDASSGKIIIKPKYDQIRNYSNGLVEVKLNDKYGLVDFRGIEVAPTVYDIISRMHEEMARVERNGYYGYIDETGREIISCKYTMAIEFSQGIGIVRLAGKWGVLTKQVRK